WRCVTDKAKLLLDAGCAVNALTVVNDYSASYPDEIYSFLKESGLSYMQFIPCVESDPDDPKKAAPFSASSDAYGHFLCRIFDLWRADFREGLPTTSVRFFESLLFRYAGLPLPECTLHEECGLYLVAEHNGDIYACDFFVAPAWRLGNIANDDLEELLNGPTQNKFGRAKAKLPDACRSCKWRGVCRGGCVKDRIRDQSDKGDNHFCGAYRTFFSHADGSLRALVAERRKQDELSAPVAPAPPGRNDLCPCGSGRKFKRCCGRS
ncbi:MAG: SPASM domain-containing protein, partial [Smithellaceae bacterium]|nr:SPASM domain-containing protein [Smithellaceae bacterium]